MGTCTMLRMVCGNRGRGNRGFLPIQMVQPNQRMVMPTPFYTGAREPTYNIACV